MVVVPVVALLETVIFPQGATCPEFVPLSVLSAAPSQWNEHPVTLNHPMRDGQPISASSPDVLASYALGVIFRSRIEDRKLCFDAYVDPAKAARLGASSLLARLRSGEVIDVSVGCHVTVDNNTSGVYAGRRYGATWRSLVCDHVAILENTSGSCSVSDGCGTRAAHHNTINNRRHTIDAYTLDSYSPPDPYSASVAALRAEYAQALTGRTSQNAEEINSRTARVSAPSRRACNDPNIVAAHGLLATIEPDPPPSLSSIRVCSLPDAYGKCDHGAITIDPGSPMYRAATRGDLLPLAMLLHHEHQHAKYGDDETSAFASSLAFLQRHHGDPRLIADVKDHLADTFSKDTQ